ncbi:hypothetical protein OSB04_009959 [Centaurea solstitialis]|uniref:Glycosyltransferase n=1 Tax=Centaurea solstitialis TaxID=347529 RepID=A0AA38T6L5_9ASTR|nr:hypothetical protein OSB04_009959 [Centaurea solstitialis]
MADCWNREPNRIGNTGSGSSAGPGSVPNTIKQINELNLHRPNQGFKLLGATRHVGRNRPNKSCEDYLRPPIASSPIISSRGLWITLRGSTSETYLPRTGMLLAFVHAHRNIHKQSDTEPFVLPGLPDRIEVTKLQAFVTPNPARSNPGILLFLGMGFFLLICFLFLSCRFESRACGVLSVLFVLLSFFNKIARFYPFKKKSWDSESSEAKTTEQKGYLERVQEAEKAAYGILVNSFEQLEHGYAQELAKAKDKNVWCIGPVSLFNKSDLDIAERGNKAAIEERGQELGSVVYVCLGTLTHSSTQQIIELGLGLEMSDLPFIWCIRNKTEEVERWFSESGFEERVGERGLIIYGWAPQVLILSHRAIGGFVTHCGWNSTLESICSGVPMVTWPHFADQFYNKKFIVQVLKIGVRIGVEIPVVMGEQDTVETMVKREEVKVAIESLMDGGYEGEERRKRGRELAELTKQAMNDGGSFLVNTTSMIQDIIKQLTINV